MLTSGLARRRPGWRRGTRQEGCVSAPFAATDFGPEPARRRRWTAVSLNLSWSGFDGGRTRNWTGAPSSPFAADFGPGLEEMAEELLCTFSACLGVSRVQVRGRPCHRDPARLRRISDARPAAELVRVLGHSAVARRSSPTPGHLLPTRSAARTGNPPCSVPPPCGLSLHCAQSRPVERCPAQQGRAPHSSFCWEGWALWS